MIKPTENPSLIMAFIEDKKFNKLVQADILTKKGEITPAAFIPKIQKLNLEEQCNFVGINIIHRRSSKSKKPIEEKAIKYIINKNGRGGFIENDEGFWIKKFIECFVKDFDCRYKTIQFDLDELDQKILHENFSQFKILKWCEKDSYWGAEFSEQISEINVSALRNRFKNLQPANYIMFKKEKSRQTYIKEFQGKYQHGYIYHILHMISIYHTLDKKTWINLAKETIVNWQYMQSGWPDITYINKNKNLKLIEVKGKDKLNANQIFVMQKLVEALGREKILVLRMDNNERTRDQRFYSKHLKETEHLF